MTIITMIMKKNVNVAVMDIMTTMNTIITTIMKKSVNVAVTEMAQEQIAELAALVGDKMDIYSGNRNRTQSDDIT